ncbi:hypothetical protein [Arcticibacter sp.]|uniref:hypothetical protein n=1 Tax=Arcticibacter sp. TaxID=1872630 RepID=UPI003890FC4A
MKYEPEPKPSDREKGRALVLAYFIIIIFFSLMQLVAAYSQGTSVIRGRVTAYQGQAPIGAPGAHKR